MDQLTTKTPIELKCNSIGSALVESGERLRGKSTAKMMNSPRRSDAACTAFSGLRGWMTTPVSCP